VPIIPALRKLRQEDGKFKASLGCTVRPFLKNKKGRKGRKEGKGGREGRRERENNIISPENQKPLCPDEAFALEEESANYSLQAKYNLLSALYFYTGFAFYLLSVAAFALQS
jgi:hypothetical protein